MQLKWKKIWILVTIVIYCASFLMQSNFVFFQTWAQEVNLPRVNIVAILVDDDIYWWISNWLRWYASQYVQWKLADTKALVMPIDLDNIKAYDIYRMMENIYFDWLKDTNSSLIGLVMFWNIPLPVVNQDWYVFPTVYPYVDFENQKYVWDEESQYFVPNGNPQWQAEIWHGLVNYWDDINSYLDFFEKVKNYDGNPDWFIWDGIWYEDFIAQKWAFLDDSFQYYRNKVMFGEDIWYQRYSPLMKQMFWNESVGNSVEIVSELEDVMWETLGWIDDINDKLSQSSSSMHTTKMLQQEIETSYLADYNELFSKTILSIIRENIFAWGRWIKLYRDSNQQASQIADVDNSSSMIQLKDTMYLWNENLQWIIENLNFLMEEMIDKKIADNKYDMDIVIPVSYEQIVWRKFLSKWKRRCFQFVTHFDNYYFWNNARNVDSAKDLSIYRWTYRNLTDLDWITYDSLIEWYNPPISKYDSVDLKLKSIGSSYDIFSTQVEWNRWYLLTAVENDLSIYNDEKVSKDRKTERKWVFGRVRDRTWPENCDDTDKKKQCENLFDFAQRWWWWASPINLVTDSISEKWRYELKDYRASDSWRPIFDMWWFQSLLPWKDEWDSGKWWIDWNWVWPQTAWTNYSAYIKYASPTQRQWWERDGRHFDRLTNYTPDVHIDFSLLDYWNLNDASLKWNFVQESPSVFSLVQKSGNPSCGNFKLKLMNTKYTYKVVSSLVKHVSTTEEEINWVDKNRYGEGGVLWWYYRGLKDAYEGIEGNISEILTLLWELKESIASKNEEITQQIKALNSGYENLSSVVNAVTVLNEEKTKLENEVSELKSTRSSYVESLNIADDADKSTWQNKIDDLDKIISAKEKQILDKEKQISSKEKENEEFEWNSVLVLLNDMSNHISEENEYLSKVYTLLISLSVDNVFSVMEQIAYMESLNPENFYSGLGNSYKVWLPKQWIWEFDGMETEILSGGENIVKLYKEMYDLVQSQQTAWKTLSKKLKDVSKSNKSKIDEVSKSMEWIFDVSKVDIIMDEWDTYLNDLDEWWWDDEDEEETEPILTESSAIDVIYLEWWLLDKFEWVVIKKNKEPGEYSNHSIKDMFNWLIEEDKVGPAIEDVAKSDKDFKIWLIKNSIDFKNFDQTDWINQYYQWTKWPWYDSEWAKKNHDLLLWISEHMSWMNILTSDRPIDSPRYVSMQSVAWKDMKFIYPDLYNVEVYVLKWKDKSGYDIHELLTWWEIKKNLVKYLKWKVYEYNKILEEECNNALNMDNKLPYYNLLKNHGYASAIPVPSLHGCSAKFTYDEFLEALGWEKMLDTISEVLYYQSLTNKKKLSSWLISEDIDLIKRSFNVNDKREQTLKYYLTEWNEEKLDPLMVIPMYELSWYEVAYVNSNWKDYIIADEDVSNISWLTKSDSSTQLRDSRSSGMSNLYANDNGNWDDECRIPPNWRLPLFELNGTSVSSPWWDWFSCWLKTVKEKPFKLRLTFDNSLGEILAADSFGDVVKGLVNYWDLEHTFSEWWDSRSKYADDWTSLVDKDTDFDSDKVITEKQVKAEEHNRGSDSSILNFMSRNIKINNTNVLLSDNNPSSELSIESISDIWVVTVTIGLIWDGCIKLDSEDLCKSNFTQNFNPKTNPFKWVITSADHLAWKVGLDIKIEIWWEYLEKVIKYTVSPGELVRADIIFWDKESIAWMLTPVEVIWYDRNNNCVLWWLDKYEFTVSQWKFLKDWSYKTSFTTNDFRNLKFYYQAPVDAKDGSEAIMQVSNVRNSDVKITDPYVQKIVQAAPEIKLNWKIIIKWKDSLRVSQAYRLSSVEGIYWGQLNETSLQKLDIDMKNLKWNIVDVDSQVIVTSQNGLVVIWKVEKNEKWENVFFETSKNYMVDGHVTVYYYPTTEAWDDIISIDIPWLDTRMIDLSILPATLKNVLIVPEKDVIELWDSINVELFLSDVWWNLVDGLNTVDLQFDDDKIEFAGYPWAEWSISVPINNWYTKLEALWTWAWLTYIIWWWTYAQVNVDKHIFPSSGLNVMYLNYFGNDRWNQWWYFSDNNQYIENLMKKSGKVITTTTQLISEEKIKRMVRKIQPWFKIWNPDNISVTLMVRDKRLNMMIWWISSMQIPIPSLTWMSTSFDEMERKLSTESLSSKNYVFFISSDIKYSIDKNWKLYNDGELVWDILWWDISLQLANYSLDNGDTVWNVIDKWVNYWIIVIHYPGFMPSIWTFTTPGKWYLLNQTFSNGSTDELSSIWIFDALSEFELDSNYKSIQNSDNIDDRIWFLGDFKNITLFAEWEIVGDATRKYGSEFVINLGDPLLSRKDKNDYVYWTKFDGGIWNEIYVDSEKDIFGTYQIDFNNDKLEDLLVVYLDWTIKLSKNYWWTPDLRDMQDLMRIAVGIQDVFVWDVDGDKYDDIIIRTNNNQLRAYLNKKWVFDVDGKVVCLNQNVFEWEISSNPSSLDWIFQIFVEDMDLDGTIDIVAYDNKWYIKVFYWWTTKWWPNYLSMEEYACDSWWYDRQVWNMVIVTALWVQVLNDKVFDNSLLRWDDIARPIIEIEPVELPAYWVEFDPNNLEGLIKIRDDNSDGDISAVANEIIGNFDVSKASQQYVDEWAKFVDVTLYENELVWWKDWNNYLFAQSSFLDPEYVDDKWSVWKNYSVKSWSNILQNGDIVTVKVTIKASDGYNFRWSYADIIQWPWKIYYDENKIMKWIRPWHNWRKSVVKKRDWDISYIVDNIVLSPWEMMDFEYDLEYVQVPLKKISLTYNTFYSDDSFPDIKMQAVDWCAKDFTSYINMWWSRVFSPTVVQLQNKINKEYMREENNTEDFTEEITSIWSNVNMLPWIVWDKISRISLLWNKSIEITNDWEWKKKLKNAILNKIGEWWLESFNTSLNIDLSLFEEQADAIENVIDDITKWMCNWFSFGWSNNCKWLPVPFNQAFLAPGKYHLFGCWDLPLWPLEWGLPVFFFPGTLPTPFWPIPIPWWQKWPGDEFLWAPGGTFPSFIRIYAAPTLTAQLWIAVCMSPEAIWSHIPSPISDIAGNCVVFAVKPQCKKSDWWEKIDLDNPNETYVDFIEDVRDSGVCLQSQKWPQVTVEGYNSSPLNLWAYSSTYSTKSVELSRDEIMLNNQEVEDVLNNLQKVIWDKVNVRKTWDNAVKPLTYIPLSLLDKIYGKDNVDKAYNLYNKYFWDAKLTVVDNYSVAYTPDVDLWIINLEMSSYIGSDDFSSDSNAKNSIMIGDVDVLGWDFTVNKIRWWLQQWVRKMLIDNWLDPQIRYILNQMTKMHINIILPDVLTLMKSDISSMKEIANNFKDSKSDSDDSWFAELWFNSNWEWISKNSLNIINNKIKNPFESLVSLMDENNIMNISTETLTVKVPMIFAEDINSYEFYLKQWLDVNERTVQDWHSVLETFVSSCSKEPDEQQQKKCREERNENLNAFIEFEWWDWTKMQNQIYANIMILQEYRNFPFEIYEWIHLIDRYMSEIASLVNNTMWYLSYWVSSNSQRFVWYVDAIVLIRNIIKTYQLLIDFSVEWWQNCGNCSKDTYDQYSCKLSMLCDMIKLPIIQIPNFKLPNITIDLSNIDLWLDIVLPEFNFQPVSVNLPELPNLPEPPYFSMNIRLFDLPNIPLLPEPPQLPELPSFIPEIELELPMLPPAPEIPKLPNSFESTIKIAKLIWKIYCIVKWQFWLVWEKSVKAKIEQLTQRTYEVKWIDNIMDFTNFSVAPVHNYGVDYEIDSYLDLQFNFTDFYDFLDTLTKYINNLTTAGTNRVNDKVDYIENNEKIESIESFTDKEFDVDLQIFGKDWLFGDKNDKSFDVLWMVSDDIEYVDYEIGKARFSDVLSYFKQEVNDTSFNDNFGLSINKIEDQISRHNSILPNEEWIEYVRGTVTDYLNSKKNNYSNLADMINSDYDGFLAMVNSQTWGKTLDDGKILAFNVQLFNVDSFTKDSILKMSKDNPYEMLLKNKQEIIDWYRNAITTNSADDLWLSKSQYLVLRNNISSMRNQVNILYNMTKPISTTNLVAKNWEILDKTLVAGSRVWSQLEVASVIDPSVMSKWIYEKIPVGEDEERFTKVVYSDLFAESMWDTYYHTNHGAEHDIILWDEKSIYKKCYDQSCVSYSWKGGWWGWVYYHSDTIKEVPYEEKWVEFDKNTKLKISDVKEEVKNRKVSGQSYDVLYFSWVLDGSDAYLIKLVERIDNSYEKADYAGSVPVHYVLALPNGLTMDDVNKTKLELLNNRIDTIQNFYWNSLLQVVYYDSNKNIVNVGLSNIDRKWYYSRIVSLDLVDDTYMIHSPWSNQVVAWRQVVWDDISPNWEPELFRPSIEEVVSEWNDLLWYVWTKYKLNVNWSDNVALSYINISKDWVILTGKYTSASEDFVSIDLNLQTREWKEIYTTLWIDQFGNETEKVITVSFEIPDIIITDISKNPGWETATIEAELSQDIDQWNVSFQRKRWEVRKTMKTNDWETSDFLVWPLQKIISGGPYSLGDKIAMYDKGWNVMALMDPVTAEIKFQTWYEDLFDVNVIVQNGVILQVYDKELQKSVFSISVPAEKCINFDANNYNYDIVSLAEEWKMGMFNGWTAIYNKRWWDNILFVSPTCHLYSEVWLEWTYDYDIWLSAVVLTLYEPSDDLTKSNPIKVWFKVKPLIGE